MRRGAHRSCAKFAATCERVAGEPLIESAWDSAQRNIWDNMRAINEEIGRQTLAPPVMKEPRFFIPPGWINW